MSITNDEMPEQESVSALKGKEASIVSVTGNKKSPGEKVYTKFLEAESIFSILKTELSSLSPQELAVFQNLKNNESKKPKELLSPEQKRLIKIVNDNGNNPKFIRLLLNQANGMLLLTEERKD
jgi:hypothetical protein